jgi:hypothetical protein
MFDLCHGIFPLFIQEAGCPWDNQMVVQGLSQLNDMQDMLLCHPVFHYLSQRDRLAGIVLTRDGNNSGEAVVHFFR